MNTNVIIFTSKTLDEAVFADSGHPCSFFIGQTRQPKTMSTRLNSGWLEGREDNPRCGHRSEPLAECTDWAKQHCWIVTDPNVSCSFREDAFFKRNFDRAPLLRPISQSILLKDNAKFPDLRGYHLPLNGLEQVFSIKHADVASVVGRSGVHPADLSEQEAAKLMTFVRERVKMYFDLHAMAYEYI